VAPSKQLRDLFIETFPAFLSKSVFIHNGVDLLEVDLLEVEQQAACQTSGPVYNPPANNLVDGPYILCVSAYKEQKAIDVLIRALSTLRMAHSAIKLVIVGSGHLRAELQDLATRLGLCEGVVFCGPQPHPQTLNLMRGCEVFVLPSRFETFGIVLLEAMACEKAVVSTVVGGIPEVVETGVNGILVRPDDPDALADAIDQLLKDETLRSQLAANGAITARDRFDFARTSGSYEAVFSRLIGKTGDHAVEVVATGV
jgi:glycosyltransferase involved in cell wall biosynthesis